MDKQKQIEEMAREIAKRDCYLYDKCPKRPQHNCVSQDPEIMLQSSKHYITIAIWLVEAGYRKIPEGAVVLTREEWETRAYLQELREYQQKDPFSERFKDTAIERENNLSEEKKEE